MSAVAVRVRGGGGLCTDTPPLPTRRHDTEIHDVPGSKFGAETAVNLFPLIFRRKC